MQECRIGCWVLLDLVPWSRAGWASNTNNTAAPPFKVNIQSTPENCGGGYFLVYSFHIVDRQHQITQEAYERHFQQTLKPNFYNPSTVAKRMVKLPPPAHHFAAPIVGEHKLYKNSCLVNNSWQKLKNLGENLTKINISRAKCTFLLVL